jgi:hypothetical protein
MKRFIGVIALVAVVAFVAQRADARELCILLSGASIIAQDRSNTFLGKISSRFASDSIFNEFGTYGSRFSTRSIWNEFSQFGNRFSPHSPFNEFSSTPPLILQGGRIVAYLTTNRTFRNGISPNLLKALCENVF